MELDILNKNNSKELIFSDWMKTMEKFQNDYKKELEQIRKDKAEIQQIRNELYNRARSGRFIHDDNRIVISAPEIIIGNVDKYGQLKSDASSTVIIRGVNVKLDGVGETGSVQTKATKIEHLAVDPGCDGVESVVHDGASIVSQARSITIDSDKGEDVYTHNPAGTAVGVSIHSDSIINVDASVNFTEMTDDIDSKCKALDTEISKLSGDADKMHSTLKNIVENMEELLANKNETDDDNQAKSAVAKFFANGIYDNTNVSSLHELYENISSLSAAFFNNVDSYLNCISQLAEKNRQKTKLKGQKLSGDKANFKKSPTYTKLILNGETVDVGTKDGNGAIHTEAVSKISINAKDIDMTSTDSDLSNIKKGNINIHANAIKIDSNNCSCDSSGNKTYPVEGSIKINSKDINIDSFSYKKEKDKEKEKTELSKDSKTTINSAYFSVRSFDSDGKVFGKVHINGKEISIRSANLDSEGKKLTKVAEGGTIHLYGENMSFGKKDENLLCKKFKVTAEEIENITEKAKIRLSVKAEKESFVLKEVSNKEYDNELKIDVARIGFKDLNTELKKGKLTLDNVVTKEKINTKDLKVTGSLDTPKLNS